MSDDLELTDELIRKIYFNGATEYIGKGDYILSALCDGFCMSCDLKQNIGQSKAMFRKAIKYRLVELGVNVI